MNLGVGSRELDAVEAEVIECLKELGGALPIKVAWWRHRVKGFKPLLAEVATGYVMTSMERKGLIEFSLKEKVYRVKEAQG